MSEKIKRYLILLIGLMGTSLGIAFMVQAKLGTSPISSLPYVFSLRFTGVSLGTFTIIWNILLILGEIVMLRKDFRPFELLQFPVSLVFGWMIDGWKALLRFVEPKAYWAQIALLLLGCAVLSFGVSFVITADTIMNPGEAFVSVLAGKCHKNFGSVKVVSDSAMVLLAIGASFLFFGKLVGVREGTVIAALISGFIIRFFRRLVEKPLARFFAGKQTENGNVQEEA